MMSLALRQEFRKLRFQMIADTQTEDSGAHSSPRISSSQFQSTKSPGPSSSYKNFEHHQQTIWDKTRTVLTRTHYWFEHEPAWYVRKKNAPWFRKPGENSTIWRCSSPKFIFGGSDEDKYDLSTARF